MSEHEGGGGAVRELLAVFGFGVETEELAKGETQLLKFLERVKRIGEAVVAAFAVEEIYEFAESQAVAMNAIERTGSQLGITTDRVQEFRFAAQSLGLEADSLLNSMGRLQVAQQSAAQGGKEQAKAFSDLGIHMHDLKGIGADELMLRVAEGISKMSDPSKQAASSVALFGREGRTLLPFLKEGRKGAEEYFDTFRELGGGYTEEAMKAGKDFDKQSAKTNLTLTALKNTIAKALLPIVTAVSKGVQVAAQWFNELAKNSNIVQAALIALGAVATTFAISMAIAFAPVIAAAVAVAALILAIDDLYTFLTGGESEIGDLIDKIFGKGAQVDTLNAIKDGWKGIQETFTLLREEIQPVWDFFKWVKENLGDIGGKIGDSVAKVKNTVVEKTGIDLESGGPIAAVKKKGAAALPKWMQAAAFAVGTLEGGGTAPGAEGSPGASIPAPIMHALPGAVSSATNNVSVNVNVPPGLNEKQVGEHVARQVGEVLKQKTREAAATAPRSGQ